MLYILECMIMGLASLAGGTDRVMYTTGEKQTRIDIWVSIFSWLVVFIIYTGIYLYIKHKRSKRA